jgi:hypothetical protein
LSSKPKLVKKWNTYFTYSPWPWAIFPWTRRLLLAF